MATSKTWTKALDPDHEKRGKQLNTEKRLEDHIV